MNNIKCIFSECILPYKIALEGSQLFKLHLEGLLKCLILFSTNGLMITGVKCSAILALHRLIVFSTFHEAFFAIWSKPCILLTLKRASSTRSLLFSAIVVFYTMCYQKLHHKTLQHIMCELPRIFIANQGMIRANCYLTNTVGQAYTLQTSFVREYTF